MQEKINISLDRELWDGLTRFAHGQSIKKGKRFSTIQALRIAIQIFLKLEPKEINQLLRRDTRDSG